jgi:hypothetical protein
MLKKLTQIGFVAPENGIGAALSYVWQLPSLLGLSQMEVNDTIEILKVSQQVDFCWPTGSLVLRRNTATQRRYPVTRETREMKLNDYPIRRHERRADERQGLNHI